MTIKRRKEAHCCRFTPSTYLRVQKIYLFFEFKTHSVGEKATHCLPGARRRPRPRPNLRSFGSQQSLDCLLHLQWQAYRSLPSFIASHMTRHRNPNARKPLHIPRSSLLKAVVCPSKPSSFKVSRPSI